MPKFEVDVEQINYGIITIEANSPQEAIKKVKQSQCEPDTLWTGSEIRPIKAEEAFA